MLKKSFSVIAAGLILLTLSSPAFSQRSFRTDGHKWAAMTADQKENYVNGFKDGEESVCGNYNLIVDKSRQYSGSYALCAAYELILTHEKMIALLDTVYETDKYKPLPPGDIINGVMSLLLSEYKSLEGRERMATFRKLYRTKDLLQNLCYKELYKKLNERLELAQKLFEMIEEHPELMRRIAE